MSDVNAMLIEPLTKFVKDSAYLVKKCTKPDLKGAFCRKNTLPLVTVRRLKSTIRSLFPPLPRCVAFGHTEFAKIARATGVGFLIMGFVGFFVKLVHIPINNIIVGGM